MNKKKYYYFYDKDYDDLLIFWRSEKRNVYVYQNYIDYLNNDPWIFTLYPYYKITSIKQLRKEMKIISKYEKEKLNIEVNYKEVKSKSRIATLTYSQRSKSYDVKTDSYIKR